MATSTSAGVWSSPSDPQAALPGSVVRQMAGAREMVGPIPGVPEIGGLFPAAQAGASAFPPGATSVVGPSLQLAGSPLTSVPTMAALAPGSKTLVSDMYNLMMQVTQPEKHIQNAGVDVSIPKNRTLYVNNLNDKISIRVLKEDLLKLFGEYGEIVDFVALSSFWRRGQAFIAFRTQEAATAALEGMQGRMYEGKPMRVNYAKSKSDIFAKEEGITISREKGPKKPKAILERESMIREQFTRLQHQLVAMNQNQSVVSGQTPDASAFGPTATVGGESLPSGFTPGGQVQLKTEVPSSFGMGQDEEEGRKRKAFSLSLKPDVPGTIPLVKEEPKEVIIRPTSVIPPATSLPIPPVSSLPVGGAPVSRAAMHPPLPPGGFPSRSLFLELLPEDCTAAELEALFCNMDGYEKVRFVASRHLAFVDFKSEVHSNAVLMDICNFEIREGQKLRVTFAKK